MTAYPWSWINYSNLWEQVQAPDLGFEFPQGEWHLFSIYSSCGGFGWCQTVTTKSIGRDVERHSEIQYMFPGSMFIGFYTQAPNNLWSWNSFFLFFVGARQERNSQVNVNWEKKCEIKTVRFWGSLNNKLNNGIWGKQNYFSFFKWPIDCWTLFIAVPIKGFSRIPFKSRFWELNKNSLKNI